MDPIIQSTEAELATTKCSTYHCYKRAVVRQIDHPTDWWRTIPDPAPFCEDCKKGNFPPDPRGFRKSED